MADSFHRQKSDTGAWEKAVHDLARMCGLNVPESKVEKFSRLGSTFLVKRFDREGDKRCHFASAMTLIGKTDGASATDGISYLDLASFIKAHGSKPKDDLLELWKRIIFNMLVTNTDDHLRNHAFMLDEKRDNWETLARKNGLTRGQIEYMRPAFDECYK